MSEPECRWKSSWRRTVVARLHAELWTRLLGRGETIGLHDLWIAATALAHGFGVVTLDRRDFERVEGLRVVAP